MCIVLGEVVVTLDLWTLLYGDWGAWGGGGCEGGVEGCVCRGGG